MIKILNKADLEYSTWFSSEIPDVEIECDGSSVRVQVEFFVGGFVGGSPFLYDETLSPDSSHRLVFSNVAGIIRHSLREVQFGTVRISVSSGSEGDTATFRVAYLHESVGVDAEASEFFMDRFLSVLDGCRRTCLGRKEVLHVLSWEDTAAEVWEEETVSIRDYYSDGTWEDRSVEKVEVRRLEWDTTMTYYCYAIDASPVSREGKELIRYVVTVGERTQEYIVDYEHEEANAVVMFINSFGVPEYAYVNGSVKGMSEYERQGAVIYGAYRNFKVKETRYWEADTGCLSEEEEEWFLDLLRSDEVYICRSGEPWKEIAIVESKAESTSDGDALNRYTFKYRISDRHQSFVGFRSYPEIFTDDFNRIFR